MILAKNEGGLGILDFLCKSQSILVKSFTKLFLIDSSITFMVDFYSFIRIGQLFNKLDDPGNVSYAGTIYYQQIIEIIQKCIHVKGFPRLNANEIYHNILSKSRPTIEVNHPVHQRKNIWTSLSTKIILPKERDTLLKFLHNVLPTKVRLKQMKRIHCSKCEYCGQEETNTHIVYHYPMVKEVVQWFTNIINNYCNLNIPDFSSLLYLEIPKLERRVKNTCIFLISTYVVCMWHMKQNQRSAQVTIRYIKGQILQKHKYMKYAMNNKISYMLT